MLCKIDNTFIYIYTHVIHTHTHTEHAHCETQVLEGWKQLLADCHWAKIEIGKHGFSHEIWGGVLLIFPWTNPLNCLNGKKNIDVYFLVVFNYPVLGYYTLFGLIPGDGSWRNERGLTTPKQCATGKQMCQCQSVLCKPHESEIPKKIRNVSLEESMCVCVCARTYVCAFPHMCVYLCARLSCFDNEDQVRAQKSPRPYTSKTKTLILENFKPALFGKPKTPCAASIRSFELHPTWWNHVLHGPTDCRQ